MVIADNVEKFNALVPERKDILLCVQLRLIISVGLFSDDRLAFAGKVLFARGLIQARGNKTPHTG